MDSLKKEIQELSKEVLEIKKTEKEENINIRILSKELKILENKIANTEKERNHIPEIIKYFGYWNEKLNKQKKKKIIKNIILGVGCGIASILLTGSAYITMLGVPVAILVVSLGLDITEINKLKRHRMENILKLGNLEKEDMHIDAIKILANKKVQELTMEINNMNQERHNKEVELNQAKEKRQDKEATYCNLTDKIQKLTKERINLSNMLLEEYENSTGEKRMSKSLFTTKNPQ